MTYNNFEKLSKKGSQELEEPWSVSELGQANVPIYQNSAAVDLILQPPLQDRKLQIR